MVTSGNKTNYRHTTIDLNEYSIKLINMTAVSDHFKRHVCSTICITDKMK